MDQDELEEALAWLFTKSDEGIAEEIEIAVLNDLYSDDKE